MRGHGPLFLSAAVVLLFAGFAGFALAASDRLALAQTGLVLIAIQRMKVGAPPEDFDAARTGRGGPAEWTVVADDSADGGRAIEQTSTDTTDYRFPLAIHREISAANVEVTLRFKPVAGKVDQAGGIAVRFSDADNYYVVRANALEDNVRFYRVVKGRREQLAGANLKVASNTWHTLGLRAEGERFTISYDGQLLYDATDATFAQAGKVALWTKSDSVTRFDQIKITPLP